MPIILSLVILFFKMFVSLWVFGLWLFTPVTHLSGVSKYGGNSVLMYSIISVKDLHAVTCRDFFLIMP